MKWHQVMRDHLPDLPPRLQQQTVYRLVERELSSQQAADAVTQAEQGAGDKELQDRALHLVAVDGRIKRLGNLRLKPRRSWKSARRLAKKLSSVRMSASAWKRAWQQAAKASGSKRCP